MSVLVSTWRNGVLDLFTTGTIAVTDAEGNLLYSHGDPNRIAYARSSAKLMQAMVPIMEGAYDHYGLTEAEIAQTCASHSGANGYFGGGIPGKGIVCGFSSKRLKVFYFNET